MHVSTYLEHIYFWITNCETNSNYLKVQKSLPEGFGIFSRFFLGHKSSIIEIFNVSDRLTKKANAWFTAKNDSFRTFEQVDLF